LNNKSILFFSCNDVDTALQILAKEKELTRSLCLLMLQLYNKLHQRPKVLLASLYQSNHKLIVNTAPLFSLLVGIDDNELSIKTDEAVLNQKLINCLYRRELDVMQQFYQRHLIQCSLLTLLYLNVLHSQNPVSVSLISDFIYLT